MEHLNSKVAAMCEHLSCSKKLCHDSLVFNQTLTAVFGECFILHQTHREDKIM